jgi:hypothetical protein
MMPNRKLKRISNNTHTIILALMMLAIYCLAAYMLSIDRMYVSIKAQITHAVIDWGGGKGNRSPRIVVYYQFTGSSDDQFVGSDSVLLTRRANRQQTQEDFNTWSKAHPLGSEISIQYLRGVPT